MVMMLMPHSQSQSHSHNNNNNNNNSSIQQHHHNPQPSPLSLSSLPPSSSHRDHGVSIPSRVRSLISHPTMGPHNSLPEGGGDPLGSLMRYNAAVIELGCDDAAILRCGFGSARLYFRIRAQLAGTLAKGTRGVYMYRAGRQLRFCLWQWIGVVAAGGGSMYGGGGGGSSRWGFGGGAAAANGR